MKFYHVSESDLHNKILHPRVPKNYMTKIGAEDGKTPRVCFSETIGGALSALGYNIKGKKFYVYVANITNQRILSNKSIVNAKHVPDAIHTKEMWVLDSVRVTLDCIIKVGEADEPLSYKYIESGLEHEAELWSWKYTKVNIPKSLIINK